MTKDVPVFSRSPLHAAEGGLPMFDARSQSFRGQIARVVQSQRAPLYYWGQYADLIGVFDAQAARAIPVVPQYKGYAGITPLGLQPFVNKPWPWDDPTRGRP